jgi:hypothetical protein
MCEDILVDISDKPITITIDSSPESSPVKPKPLWQPADIDAGPSNGDRAIIAKKAAEASLVKRTKKLVNQLQSIAPMPNRLDKIKNKAVAAKEIRVANYTKYI